MSNKVAAIQMVSTADVPANLEAAARLIAAAASDGAELVLLPETFAVLEGGPMRQYGELEGTGTTLLQGFLSAQASRHQIMLVGGTIPLISRPGTSEDDPDRLIADGRVRASSLVFDRTGQQLARYDKIHLFDVTVAEKSTH